jgi:hypothetical protein
MGNYKDGEESTAKAQKAPKEAAGEGGFSVSNF